MQKLLLCPVFILFSVAIVQAQIPTNGLIRYYPFTGSAADFSPSAQHGIVVGATLTTDRFGNPNAAYDFDGSNDYIQIPATDLALDQYAYSAWAELRQVPNPGDQYMVLNIGGPGGDQYVNVDNYYLGIYNGWGVGGYNSNGTQYFSPPGGDAAAQQWVHIVSTRSANVLKFYFNGILAAVDSSAAPTTPYYGNDPIVQGFIGIRNNLTFPFNGKIDDIRIYDHPISDQEVVALYNEGLCFQSIAVTDTLIINTDITGYNPLTYQHSIKIFPNPANDHLSIDCGSNYASLSGYSIRITNSLGQQVYQTAINQQQFVVDLTTWSGNGTYFIYLIDAQSNIIDVRKIILQ